MIIMIKEKNNMEDSHTFTKVFRENIFMINKNERKKVQKYISQGTDE